MEVRVQKWGNSLAVRIPRSIAADAHLQETTRVDLAVVDGKIVISSVPRPRFELAELLEGVTNENLHPEVFVGPPLGAEEW